MSSPPADPVRAGPRAAVRRHARIYSRLLVAGVRRQSTYRLAALGGLVANVTIGLDVLSKQRLREFLVQERRLHGTTLLLTTHDMGDVERLCDRVLVVDLAAPTADLIDVPGTRHTGSEAGGLRQRLAFDAEVTTAAQVLTAVAERAEVLDLAIEEPDVEDVVRRVYAARR